MKIGDRVKYSRVWLRNTGNICGEIPFKRGRVVSVKPMTEDRSLVMVKWDGDPDHHRVLNCNLVQESDSEAGTY